tara:strand:+ start:299 stop:1903 length:1605 start_codon:yes stop_codon:yes gene_type:complete
MPGGYIQLAAYGSQDFYLTSNPQISFFKTVYRRYTNFSMDYFRLNPLTNIGLNDNDTITYKFKIDRNADLIHDCYFTFTLPDIYSDNNLDFRWVKNIGFNIIESVSIYIGGSLIDQHYGEWLQIWTELTTPLDKKHKLDEMIGNVTEMYDPANASGMVGIYPNSSIINGRNGLKVAPSIFSRKIRVPLIFWFNRNPSLALPLIALQYDPIQLNVTCRKITDLYTIIDNDVTSISYGKIIKPSSTNTNYTSSFGIQNFINDTNIYSGKVGNKQLVNFSIDPYLDINYIYLDTKEMKNFAQTEHKYLIEQVRLSTFKGILGSKTLNLDLQHPTSLMVIVCKRTDVEDRNDWNNYTNWVLEDVPPYSITFENPYHNKYELDFEKADAGGKKKFKASVNNLVHEKINPDNFEFKKDKNCLKNISLILNGTERLSTQEPDFFNQLQSYNYSKANPKGGIYPYSFSIDPFKYQPSGSCNMSRFNSIELNVETQETPIPNVAINNESELTINLYKYDINIYTINYNILRIVSGMGNIEFST